MSIHPPFLALLTCLIVAVSIIGSNDVRLWRVLGLFIVGVIGLSAFGGAYSFLGPGPAIDSAGQIIRDAGGHTLYRPHQVASAEGFMNATLYLSLGSLIGAGVLLFGMVCSRGITVLLPERFRQRY